MLTPTRPKARSRLTASVRRPAANINRPSATDRRPAVTTNRPAKSKKNAFWTNLFSSVRSVQAVLAAGWRRLHPRKARKFSRTLTKPLSTEPASTWLDQRLATLLLLGLSSIALALLLTKVSPSKVADIGLAQSYLPLLLLIALVTFSLARLALIRRHAVYVSAICTLFVFVAVHSVSFPLIYTLLPFAVIALLELLDLSRNKK